MQPMGEVYQMLVENMTRNKRFFQVWIYHMFYILYPYVTWPIYWQFSLLHIVQTGSGVHPTSYKMGTGGSFPGVKRQGREADHSPPTSAEVKKMWIYTSTPLYVFMA
jgi:hypothetical protein